ncbi:hypothetical protein [Hydrogenophaga taeniospiralis]|nr:hypothetical protein [Hydrogenophaga taeniospiralis]
MLDENAPISCHRWIIKAQAGRHGIEALKHNDVRHRTDSRARSPWSREL